MKLNILKSFVLAAALATVAVSCAPDEVEGGNALTQADIDASFTATTANGNTYVVTGSDDSNIQYHTWKWTSPDGASNPQASQGEIKGNGTMEFIFPIPGTYTLQHRVVGYNGGKSSVSEQTFTVTTFALEDNIVESPNFENASDWTVFNTGGTQTVTWAFNNGNATASGGVANNYTGQGIYQAVNVEAGKYRVDMHVQSPGASDAMWFQVFTGTTQPVNGSDYGSDPTVMIGLNTWAGCALSPFNGQLSAVGCVGTGTDVTFTQPGTIYLVIKAGTGADNGVNNISVSDVSMRKYIE